MTTTSEHNDTSLLGALAGASSAVVERLQRGMVAVRSPRGGGSGTIWSTDGLIVTNNHVLGDDRAEVVTWDDRAYPATLVARDPEHDLATLRVNASGLPALEVADSSAVRVGQIALAVGNPWGQRGAVTAGIIFSTGGVAAENGTPLPEAIRADVRLAPGNSGGPLADAEGRVIGINSMIAGGMAVAVPSNTAARFVAGEMPGQGFIGIFAQPVPLPPAIAAAAGLPEAAGLLLTGIEPGSPADRAGLIPGDVLVGFDDTPGGLQSMAGRLRRMRPGAKMRMNLLRGSGRTSIDVIPVARI
jgi:serine protease Do